MQSSYYANGDWYASVRYSKQELFGLPLFGAFRYTQYWDRDNVFVVPNTKEEFVQPDSTMKFQWRIGSPLNDSKTLNISTNIGLNFVDESVPDNAKDSLLLHQKFAIKDRGIYQKSTQVPIELAFIFDNLDFSYAPSKGSRFLFSAEYTFVNQYHGLKYSDVGINKVGNYKDGGLNHDFIRNQIIFQHYFYLGKSNHYILSKTEARQSRRFYTDFSWDEALRVWHPDKIKETLFERRVLAIQFRMENMWETEEGGAPFNAYPYLNGRYPLRGYGNQWAAAHIMGLSAEYRWPVDRFVDGVVFNEYALHAPEIDDWSFDRYYNSWGIGVRVRQPNMYLFRLQFGFHGLHGINIIMTIAPEFK